MLDWPFTSHLSHHPWHLAASTVQLNPALNTSSAACSEPQQSAANASFSPFHVGSLQQFGINPLGPFLRSAWGSPYGSFLGLEDLPPSSSSVCSSLTSRDSTPPPATSPLSPPVHPPASKKCTFDAAFPSPPPCYPSSPLDDEASDWIEVRHRVLLFKEWREKRRRGDKEEGCSLMRVALETPA